MTISGIGDFIIELPEVPVDCGDTDLMQGS